MSSQVLATVNTPSMALTTPNTPSPAKVTPKKVVLEEDNYVDAIEKIIQRDFFPDLPKLNNQLEWLEAVENNDVEKMREIQFRYAQQAKRQGRRTDSILRGTPSFATPSTTGSATPVSSSGSSTPSSATPSSTTSAASTPRGGDVAGMAAGGQQSTTPNTKLRLDAFLAKHTSEDNASFENILDVQHEKWQERHTWMEEKAREAKQMLLDAAHAKSDVLLLEPSTSGMVQTWQYTGKNQLMYIPEGVEAPTELQKKGPPKEIKLDNTRFVAPQPVASTQPSPNLEQASEPLAVGDTVNALVGLRRAQKDHKVDLDDFFGTPRSSNAAPSPHINGYGFVATPSPAPGRDGASPFMTWGRMDATPLLLEPPSTPFDLTPGPSFKVPEPPLREKVAMELAERTGLKLKAPKSSLTPTRPSTPGAGQTPKRARLLSPAAKSLADRTRAKTLMDTSADSQLRASYSSPLLKRKVPTVGGVTPTNSKTPLSGRSTPLAPATPTTIRSGGVTVTGSGSSSSNESAPSITDDLLNL